MSRPNNNYFNVILIILLFYNHTSNANSREINWVKINDKENVQVYSTDVIGSDILKIKTQVEINASIKEVQSILDNVKHRKNWIPYLKDSVIIDTLSNTEKVEYSFFSAPWPATDRDFVYKLTQTLHNESKIIYYMTSTTHHMKPDNDDLIRAELMESTYILSAISPQKTRVELIFHADPKGWLPNWIINIIQRVLPYLILRNLRYQATNNDNNA